ncbi:unnamed protein product [Symbiodinium microadriaticum]|nr:unnamed protein product [Symbiodinium microadriaticum]
MRFPAACDYECEEEGFMCEGCEKSIRSACAGLVPGLEFLADTGSEEDLISKSDHEAHFSGTPVGGSDRPIWLITAYGPVQANKSVKLEVLLRDFIAADDDHVIVFRSLESGFTRPPLGGAAECRGIAAIASSNDTVGIPEEDAATAEDCPDFSFNHTLGFARVWTTLASWRVALVADNEIAAAWYQDLDKEELGDAAAYHGTTAFTSASVNQANTAASSRKQSWMSSAIAGDAMVEVVVEDVPQTTTEDAPEFTMPEAEESEDISGCPEPDISMEAVPETPPPATGGHLALGDVDFVTEPSGVDTDFVAEASDVTMIDEAKQIYKVAEKASYSSIVARFDNDVDYTTHSMSNGFDREHSVHWEQVSMDLAVMRGPNGRSRLPVSFISTTAVQPPAGQDYTPEEWDQWLRHQLNRQLQPARRTHEEKLRNAERSRAAQLEADARRFVKGKEQSKGSGKGGRYCQTKENAELLFDFAAMRKLPRQATVLPRLRQAALQDAEFETRSARPRAQETVLAVQLGLLLSKRVDEADSQLCGAPCWLPLGLSAFFAPDTLKIWKARHKHRVQHARPDTAFTDVSAEPASRGFPCEPSSRVGSLVSLLSASQTPGLWRSGQEDEVQPRRRLRSCFHEDYGKARAPPSGNRKLSGAAVAEKAPNIYPSKVRLPALQRAQRRKFVLVMLSAGGQSSIPPDTPPTLHPKARASPALRVGRAT